MSLLNLKNITENKDNNTMFKPNFSEVKEVGSSNIGLENEAKSKNIVTHTEKPKESGNFNSLLDHISKPREKVSVNPHLEQKREEERANTETKEPDNTETEEAENVVKQDAAYYEGIGNFSADLTDIALPNIIAYLNEEKDETPYCAESKIKKQIAVAYARFFEEKGKQLSPTAQLMTTLGMAYGIPLGMAGFNKVMKTLESYKAKKIELEKLQIKAANPETQPTPEQPKQTPAEPPKTKIVSPEFAPFFAAFKVKKGLLSSSLTPVPSLPKGLTKTKFPTGKAVIPPPPPPEPRLEPFQPKRFVLF